MTTPTPPAAGGSLAAKVGGPRNLAILGAGLSVALVALIGLRRNSSAGAAGTVTTSTSDTAFDSGPYDMWNQWQSEYEDLQQQISSQQAGQTTTTPPTLTPGPPVPVPVTKPPIPMPAPKPPWGKPIPKPPTTPPKKQPKAPATKTVVVNKGDSLSAIAARNGISMATLKKLNPVYWTNKKYKNGNLIWAGDKVKV